MPAKKIFQILLKEARYSQLIPGLRQQALQINRTHVVALCDQLQFSKQHHPGCAGASVKVTAALLLRCSALTQNSCPFYRMKIVISLVKGVF